MGKHILPKKSATEDPRYRKAIETLARGASDPVFTARDVAEVFDKFREITLQGAVETNKLLQRKNAQIASLHEQTVKIAGRPCETRLLKANDKRALKAWAKAKAKGTTRKVFCTGYPIDKERLKYLMQLAKRSGFCWEAGSKIS